jgi:hypothetical protein
VTATRCAALGLALASACFEYSPHAVVLDPSERDLHAKALARLDAAPPGDTARFAVLGDSQQTFDDAADAVRHLNGRSDVDFVVQAGDFVHVAILPEFRAMNDVFARLRVPYFVVPGIHDLLGKGPEIFEAMFGPRQLSFTFRRTRFALFDSNSLEAGFTGTVPDLAWLAAHLAADGSYDLAVLISHVAPDNAEFDPSLREGYEQLLRAQPEVLSFHAHEHRFRSGGWRGTPLYVADSLDHRTYLLATVLPGGRYEIERVEF